MFAPLDPRRIHDAHAAVWRRRGTLRTSSGLAQDSEMQYPTNLTGANLVQIEGEPRLRNYLLNTPLTLLVPTTIACETVRQQGRE